MICICVSLCCVATGAHRPENHLLALFQLVVLRQKFATVSAGCLCVFKNDHLLNSINSYPAHASLHPKHSSKRGKRSLTARCVTSSVSCLSWPFCFSSSSSLRASVWLHGTAAPLGRLQQLRPHCWRSQTNPERSGKKSSERQDEDSPSPLCAGSYRKVGQQHFVVVIGGVLF